MSPRHARVVVVVARVTSVVVAVVRQPVLTAMVVVAARVAQVTHRQVHHQFQIHPVAAQHQATRLTATVMERAPEV